MSTMDDLVVENEEWVDKTIPENVPVKARLDEIKLNVRSWTPRRDDNRAEIDPSTGEVKPQEIRSLEWWWVITDTRDDGLYYDRRVKGECKPEMNTNPRNRINQWASALMGREIGVGEKLNLRDLTGMHAYISVAHKPDKNDPTMKWERVDEVIPLSMFDGTAGSEEPPF